MSKPSSTLPLEVVAVFGAAWNGDHVDRFRRGVSALVKRVERSIQSEHPHVQLHPRCVSAAQASNLEGEGMPYAVGVLDVSDRDARVALFAGRLQGADVPHVIVCQADSEDAARALGLGGPNLVTYRSIDELFQADSILQQELLRAVPHARIHAELVYQFWFPRETSTIWVVCPQIHEPGEFAERSSPDYTYLDNLGDTDALLEVMVFLSQRYPNATIERFSSQDLPKGHTSSNLVVVGGPGSGEISNEICREMMVSMRSRVAYSTDCEQMTVTGTTGEKIELRAEYRATGERNGYQAPSGLQTDWGYFARFRNPLNQNATVVLINGIHTAGVLGAARAFGERREALRNFRAALASDAGTTNFECHFEVTVLNGQVKVPVVDSRNMFALGPPEEAVAGAQPSTHERAPVAQGRPSVRILFIVGDRGGSQVNLLQIPKEYHALKDALRACARRDVIALANPILGATRDRLALVYRERPTVIHFAGHGDDRSLSIIENHGVLANATRLDANQLITMLRTLQEPVWLFVLNACASLQLAQQLVGAGVATFAIGWPAKVSDSAAIALSTALYGALGDGRSIIDALAVARVACGTADEPILVGETGTHARLFMVEAEDER